MYAFCFLKGLHVCLAGTFKIYTAEVRWEEEIISRTLEKYIAMREE